MDKRYWSALWLRNEQLALFLDEIGDEEMAEQARTLLDFIWQKRLTTEERAEINARPNVVAPREQE